MARFFPEWDDPFLAAFAAHMQLLAVEVHVGEVEPYRLGAPQPGRIDELDEGAVAQGEGAVAPSVKRRKLRIAATFRAIVAGASFRGRARPSSDA